MGKSYNFKDSAIQYLQVSRNLCHQNSCKKDQGGKKIVKNTMLTCQSCFGQQIKCSELLGFLSVMFALNLHETPIQFSKLSMSQPVLSQNEKDMESITALLTQGLSWEIWTALPGRRGQEQAKYSLYHLPCASLLKLRVHRSCLHCQFILDQNCTFEENLPDTLKVLEHTNWILFRLICTRRCSPRRQLAQPNC